MRNSSSYLLLNVRSLCIPRVACIIICLLFVIWLLTSLGHFAFCQEPSAAESGREKLLDLLVADLRSQSITSEQAAAIYASLYARGELPVAQRQIWRVSLQAQNETKVSFTQVRPLATSTLDVAWQERLAIPLKTIDPLFMLEVDTKWERVRDRSLLAQRIDRSATLIQTKNFLIEADVSESALAEIVFECELTHSVVSRLCNLNADHPPLAVRVVRNRAAYLKLLKQRVAQIGITSGYFDIEKNTVFCYLDKQEDTSSSLRHELTHLILTNSWAEDSARDYKTITDFWAFEAIATYIESLILRSGVDELCCMVGGWEAPRLQAARYRRLHDMSWIPFNELRVMNQSEYQAKDDIQLRYSQSAGLAHYWLDESIATRNDFVRYLQSVHRGTPDASILGIKDDEAIRQQYDTFLLASRESFQTYALQPARKDIVLSRTSIRSEDLILFPTSHRKFDWFDLSFTNVDGAWLIDPEDWDATRLNVESTSIANEDLRNIAKMRSLRELDVSHCKVNDAGLRELAGLQQLETLWLTGTAITDAAANVLRSLRSLKAVEISSTSANPTAFKSWQLRP